MSVSHVEVLVEEPSMEAALRLLLPRLLRGLAFEVHAHQGKTDLLAKLPLRLQGYAAWIREEHRIAVIVDRDDEDCRTLKAKLESIAQRAGLPTRSTAKSADAVRVIPRVAVEELEAWFFGDWDAVRAAYPGVPNVIVKRRFRDPDGIRGGTWEALEQVLQGAGYFTTGLRKIEAARAIARHMDPGRNQSKSFRALRDALSELVA